MRKAAQHWIRRSLITLSIIFLSLLQPGAAIVSAATPTPVDSASTLSATQKTTKVILSPNTKYATEMYIISSGVPGPVVLVTGGIHGNEKAGYLAADQLRSTTIRSGTLLVIPRANKLADNANTRAIKGEKDLNRAFPTSKTGQPSYTPAKAIYAVVKQYKVNWVMDMHEGYGYSAGGSASVGQSLIYYPSTACTAMTNTILKQVNAGIKTSSHRFVALRYPVGGSLARSSAQYLGTNSFIFETCTKDSINTRISEQLLAANTLLKQLKMK